MAAPTTSQLSVAIYQDKVLGVGSYGKVCKAKYGQLPCAAKLLHNTMFESGDPGICKFEESFQQECQFLSMIKHPNIVQYLETIRDPQSKSTILLMELMEESLTKFLERSTNPLPYHIQLNICHDVALALSYLHSNGIIHRDLSSNNVLLICEGTRAKVTDFGMSKLIDINPRMTPLTLCPGATVYMPPEALTTPPRYTSKLDCFSHGVLAIQILTRNFPNPGDAHQKLQDPRYPDQHLFRQVPETERRKKDINLIDSNHSLLPIAISCLEISDKKRPPSDELCEQLATLKKDKKYECSLKQITNQVSLDLLQRLKEVVEQKDQFFRECNKLMDKERADHHEELTAKKEEKNLLIEEFLHYSSLLDQEIEEKNRIIGEQAQTIGQLRISKQNTQPMVRKLISSYIHKFMNYVTCGLIDQKHAQCVAKASSIWWI